MTQFYAGETPVDLMWQVASMLDFISEALSGVGNNPAGGLSANATEGLATLCNHLNLICQEATRSQAAL